MSDAQTDRLADGQAEAVARDESGSVRRRIDSAGSGGSEGAFEPAMPAAAALMAAARIESDPSEVVDWYRTTPIALLDEFTAEELVAAGRLEDVLAFLRAIERARGE